mgnify:CR=1 FL=1
MAVSGTTSFALTLDEALEEIYSRIGGEPVLGGEARDFLRTINLLMADLQTRGLLLFTLEQQSAALTTALATVSLSSDTWDINSLYVRRTSVDTPMTRISHEEFANINDKFNQGRPQLYYLDRQRDVPTLWVWPRSENATDTLRYYKIRFIQDAGRLANDPDLPRRYWPALVAGLTYFCALRRGLSFPIDRLNMLKMEYEEVVQRALDADSESGSLFVVPLIRTN